VDGRTRMSFPLNFYLLVISQANTTIRYIKRAVIAQSVWRLGYGLDDRGSRVRFPVGAGNFSLHHRVQNGSGALSTSYPIGTRGSFPGGKAAGA
jgi:hypothetical protein